MSITTKAIGLAKKAKHRFQKQIAARRRVYLSPVRRIERVALSERICAMTFDDGPCALAANPAKDERPLTLCLLETLEKYGAHGTFDIVGDTSANYPDTPGKEGSAQWGGIAFDHYPDFGKDEFGGAVHCPELVRRILSGGHEITNHTYSHVLFGPKPLVYGGRKPLADLDAVVEDLGKLHRELAEKHGFEMKLSRPPHYVDNLRDGFSSYDAYALLGYQYMAASFDGAGWLPLASYAAEVEATWKPLAEKLKEDPDYFCGQIIFQKDGYNMARRSPVADGLERQLALLTENGYKVVSVSELMALCPFADVSPQDGLFASAKKLLEHDFCIVFRDNCIKKDTPLTRGALAMMLFGTKTAESRIGLFRDKTSPFSDVSHRHPYAAAVKAAAECGAMPPSGRKFRPDDAVTKADFSRLCEVLFGKASEKCPKTHGDAIMALAELV